MTETRIGNLARMGYHRARLNAISNDKVIDLFLEAGPRRFNFKRIIVEDGRLCLSLQTVSKGVGFVYIFTINLC